MKSEIKDICSADVLDIQNYHPEDPTCFGFWITLIVGIQGTDSGESFQLCVCSPTWIQSMMDKNKCNILIGLHHLVMTHYNYSLLCKKLTSCFCVEGDNWDDICQKLSYYGHWEFQDYEK